ncbi:MAG: DUF805 domain-containing protein [Hyphomicrobium sp.]|nr:DUF805 domain-containing protein [Hyphomicrobium sp.]
MALLINLLTSLRGRINRAKWWLGLAIIGITNVLGGLLLNPDFFTAEELPPPSGPDTIWQIALLLPMTAITVKRFNDTDRPAWLGYLFAPLGVVLYLRAARAAMDRDRRTDAAVVRAAAALRLLPVRVHR